MAPPFLYSVFIPLFIVNKLLLLCAQWPDFMAIFPLSWTEAFWHCRHSADASIHSDLQCLQQQNELHLTDHQHYKRPISEECMLAPWLVSGVTHSPCLSSSLQLAVEMLIMLSGMWLRCRKTCSSCSTLKYAFALSQRKIQQGRKERFSKWGELQKPYF